MLDLISLAGGISAQSAGSNILIWRGQANDSEGGRIISIETEVSGWQQRAMVLCHFSLLPGVEKIITNTL